MRTATRSLALPTALLLTLGLAACDFTGGTDTSGTTGTVSPQSTAATSSRTPSSETASAGSTASAGTGLGTTTDTATSGSDTSSSASDASPSSSVDSTTVSAQDLKVGDCFTEMGTETSSDGGVVNTVDVVNCSQPHLYEVYEEGDLSADSLPTGDALDQQTGDICYDAFETYVGTPLDSSSLTATALTPTSVSWTLGDRTVSCVVMSQNGSDLTGSAKDSKA